MADEHQHHDPTFYRSPRDAAAGPPEKLAYVATFSRPADKPDGIAVVDTDPGSASYASVIGYTELPNLGDEVVQFVAQVRQLGVADHGGVAGRAGVGVHHRDPIGLVGRPGEGGHVSELLRRARRRVAGGAVERGVVVLVLIGHGAQPFTSGPSRKLGARRSTVSTIPRQANIYFRLDNQEIYVTTPRGRPGATARRDPGPAGCHGPPGSGAGQEPAVPRCTGCAQDTSSQPPSPSAPSAIRPNTPVHRPPGRPVSRASWSASFDGPRPRRRSLCSSSTGRTPPNNSSHVIAYPSAAAATADRCHSTTTIAAPASSTASRP